MAYLIVSGSAVLLGVGSGPMGFGPPGTGIVALLSWVLTAAAAEVVVGGRGRLGVLPWALGATLLAVFCGPGAATAVLGAAAVVYGLRTIAIVAPVRRVSPVARRAFDITTDINTLPDRDRGDSGAFRRRALV